MRLCIILKSCIIFIQALNECTACLKMAEEKRVSQEWVFPVWETYQEISRYFEILCHFCSQIDENANIRIPGFSGWRVDHIPAVHVPTRTKCRARTCTAVLSGAQIGSQSVQELLQGKYSTQPCHVPSQASSYRRINDADNNVCWIFYFRVSSPRPSHDHWNGCVNIPVYIPFSNMFAWYTWTC